MKHHLDDLIETFKKHKETMEVTGDLFLLILQEVKRIDENHEQLSDWVHDYDA